MIDGLDDRFVLTAIVTVQLTSVFALEAWWAVVRRRTGFGRRTDPSSQLHGQDLKIAPTQIQNRTDTAFGIAPS